MYEVFVVYKILWGSFLESSHLKDWEGYSAREAVNMDLKNCTTETSKPLTVQIKVYLQLNLYLKQ
jgi:hypothetical protein